MRSALHWWLLNIYWFSFYFAHQHYRSGWSYWSHDLPHILWPLHKKDLHCAWCEFQLNFLSRTSPKYVASIAKEIGIHWMERCLRFSSLLHLLDRIHRRTLSGSLLRLFRFLCGASGHAFPFTPLAYCYQTSLKEPWSFWLQFSLKIVSKSSIYVWISTSYRNRVVIGCPSVVPSIAKR